MIIGLYMSTSMWYLTHGLFMIPSHTGVVLEILLSKIAEINTAMNSASSVKPIRRYHERVFTDLVITRPLLQGLWVHHIEGLVTIGPCVSGFRFAAQRTVPQSGRRYE